MRVCVHVCALVYAFASCASVCVLRAPALRVCTQVHAFVPVCVCECVHALHICVYVRAYVCAGRAHTSVYLQVRMFMCTGHKCVS